MNSLDVTNLSFSYAEKPIFINASMSVESDSIIGLLGPNGSGKTTFFDIICGLTNNKASEISNTFKDQLFMINEHTFQPFRSGDEFKKHYHADSLDKAFICAASTAAS